MANYHSDHADTNATYGGSMDYSSLKNYNTAGIHRFAHLAPVARVAEPHISAYQRLANTRPVVALRAPAYGGSGRQQHWLNMSPVQGDYPLMGNAYAYSSRY